MKVRFNRAALADISEIIEYIEAHNRGAAINLLSRFEAGADLIGAFQWEAQPLTAPTFADWSSATT